MLLDSVELQELWVCLFLQGLVAILVRPYLSGLGVILVRPYLSGLGDLLAYLCPS